MSSDVKIYNFVPTFVFNLGSISNKISPCPMDCDLSLSKEDRELHNTVR